MPAHAGDASSIPGSRRSPGVGNGNRFQYSCLENSMDRGAWKVILNGVTESRTWLSREHTRAVSNTLLVTTHVTSWASVQCGCLITKKWPEETAHITPSVSSGFAWHSSVHVTVAMDQVISWLLKCQHVSTNRLSISLNDSR